MDSNETKNRLKELIGTVGYVLVMCQLRNVKLKIDPEKKLVTITEDTKKHEFSFDEIEQLVNE
ncbi:hypothetical protein LCGC14_1451750 [marine sediment metagenome]|uniref:Uncharacterized protein n=1 Tax=marine sediment metagenome TaxID=412755 RepID=A0A0F9JHL0_9ZZZZ